MATGKRMICLVADGFGVGASPDAAAYGDVGSDTLGNTARAVGGIKLPNLEKLGLGRIGNFPGLSSQTPVQGFYGRLQERSRGKDTTTGHWELAGLITEKPFATFPDGFTEDLLRAWVKRCDLPGYLGNRAASGTTILDELGAESVRTGKPIVYTSADSVFQVAAHEKHFGLERLQKICREAREMTLPLQIGRVISRPFLGEEGSYRRTENRRDYSIEPGHNCLDLLAQGGVQVCGVGKIEDIFNHRSIHRSDHTGNNRDSLNASLQFLRDCRGQNSFVFVNLVDFDMLYGHRRDPVGYAKALVELDVFLPQLLAELQEGDSLFLTSDHGCDPTFRGSDHTREFVPLVGYAPGRAAEAIGDRTSFADVAATLLKSFAIAPRDLPGVGKSFLN